MATNPFRRLVNPNRDEQKIPVHVFFSIISLLDRGLITPAQFHTICGTDNEDIQPGGQIHALKAKLDAGVNDRTRYAVLKDVWNLCLVAEWDTGNGDILGLDSLATFGQFIDDIVAWHNTRWLA